MPIIDCSAVLFDLDGTLIDSTAAVVAHWTDFAGEHGLDPAVILATSHGRRTYEILQEHIPEKADWDYVKAWEADIPRRHGDQAVALPGAIDLINGIKKVNGKWGIVTSGTFGLATQWLKVLNIPMPEVFITADVVKTGKPSPEGYLLGRERLTVSGPNHTVVVFEDAVAGVKAGKAAGAIVVAVLETHGREELLKAGADYVVDGLHQVQVVNMEGNSTRIALNVQEKKSESNGI